MDSDIYDRLMDDNSVKSRSDSLLHGSSPLGSPSARREYDPIAFAVRKCSLNSQEPVTDRAISPLLTQEEKLSNLSDLVPEESLPDQGEAVEEQYPTALR